MDYTDITCFPPDDKKIRLLLKKNGKKPLLVLGLNPSTADEKNPDATIRKIMGFAERWGYDSFIMINVYPLRCTLPSDLPKEFDEDLHIQNYRIIEEVVSSLEDTEVLVCYGDNITIQPYLEFCKSEILKMFSDYSKLKLVRISDLTIKGNPRHPCRLSYKSPKLDFEV